MSEGSEGCAGRVVALPGLGDISPSGQWATARYQRRSRTRLTL